MLIHTVNRGLASVFHISGRLDSSATAELEAKVLESLDGGAKHLLLDFSQLEYINSAGLRVLVMSYQRLNPQGGRILICGVRDYIAEIFDISGYNRIFSMHADTDSALREIGATADGQ